MDDETDNTSEWLPISEAAGRRGISVDAVYKAIARGAVAARGLPRHQQARWADVAALRGIRGLLPGTKPVGASVRTDATAQTARVNGKRGGRPKHKQPNDTKSN